MECLVMSAPLDVRDWHQHGNSARGLRLIGDNGPFLSLETQ
jgi:hypothetical protein